MIIKNLFLFIFTTLLITFTIGKVEAVPSAPWVEVTDCGIEGFPVSKASEHISQIRYLDQFSPGHLNTCIKNDTIGAIVEDWSAFLSICPNGYMIPYNNSSPEEYDLRFGCCPSGVRFIYNPDGNTIPFCSTRSDIDKAERSSVNVCSNNSGDPYQCPYNCAARSDTPCIPKTSSGPAGPFKAASESNTAYFYDATTKFACNFPNCVFSATNMYKENNPGPYSESQIGSDFISCTVDAGVSNLYTCVKGTWYLTSVLDDWKDRLGEFLTCNEFVNTTEKENCMSCYKDCITENTCSYSSLGCIQTTQDGIIVRVFQIGLGIVGALAIARFIQAALLRQTADPSKIQESYDIITSIIIGIVVLLGSSVILRFIGVDILQMMPF